MSTVYAISSGSYSDYSINGMFSTKEKAQEYINKSVCQEELRIEEYILDELVKDNLMPFYVDLINGEIESIETPIYDFSIKNTFENRVRIFIYEKDYEYCCDLYFRARDKDHAIKIARERWGQIKALNWFEMYRGKSINFYTKEELK